MFKLSDKFLDNFKGKQPKWGFGDLSYLVFKRTYSRLKDDGTQEEFWETLKRVTEGTFRIQEKHCKAMGLPWNSAKAQKSAQIMFEKMWDFKFLPPGRGLWLMGTDVIDKIGSAGLNNCGFTSTKNIKHDFGAPFAWACDMMMLGVGIGFDTKGAGTLVIQRPTDTAIVFAIPDTREGWANAVNLLLDSYMGDNRHSVEFDYTELRPAGAPIKTFGGIASGPAALRDGLEDIRNILNSLDGYPITSVAITDIMNIIGRFVVAGGTRRSAEISIGNVNDIDFLEMKNPSKFPEELRNHRWMSNNSVFAKQDSDFDKIIHNILSNGEPGLMFLDNARHYGRFKDGYLDNNNDRYDAVDGANPCMEQQLHDKELCCLVETFPANHDSVEEYLETLKYAYLYAKTVTLVPTHDSDTNQVMLQNRRIGLSQSGIQQAIKKFGTAKYFNDFCDKAYDDVVRWDKIYSRWLGVPTSIRKTTVKPSGTVSILAGSTPGVHCTHSEFYFRTVRLSANDKLVKSLLDSNYRIEFSVTDKRQFEKAATLAGQHVAWRDMLSVREVSPLLLEEFAKQAGTLVVYFPVKEKLFTKSKYDISLWEQLVLVKELQHHWSDNMVSCTITFTKNESKDLKAAIEFFAPYVKSLSFLPLEDNHYLQAPYSSISKEDYDVYSRQLKPLFLTTSSSGPSGEKYCSNDTCSI